MGRAAVCRDRDQPRERGRHDRSAGPRGARARRLLADARRPQPAVPRPQRGHVCLLRALLARAQALPRPRPRQRPEVLAAARHQEGQPQAGQGCAVHLLVRERRDALPGQEVQVRGVAQDLLRQRLPSQDRRVRTRAGDAHGSPREAA